LAAIRQINNAYDVAVIHGPPGTGKTTTVVHAVVEVCKYERQVLVAAPSNTAADLLTERLAEQGLQVVRIGNISRVDETLLKHTLEGQISTHPESKNIKKLRIKAAELRNLARTFKRRMDYEARSRRQQLKDEARELAAWATNLEERMIQQILDGAQVITSTLVGSSHPVLHNLKFRTVFIDEAAQGLEPATWIPILKATRVVFAGDPFQLPPTVKSIEAAKRGLQITQIEKCIQRFHNVNLLNVQYRMHKNIMNFSNAVFYDNQLIAHESVENKKLHFYENEEAVTFVDTAGCGFDEKVNPESLSRFNAEEFFILREHLYQLVEKFDSSVDFPLPSIGIVSPYREQVEFMETQILEDPILADFLKKKRISISTIDGFQGQERDVMYISLVRSNPKFEIGFLSDTRRMNVAMTRARMKLIVVGDSSTIGNHHFYKAFLDYAEKNGAYRTAWEFMAT
jgi:predicted DNA helicase